MQNKEAILEEAIRAVSGPRAKEYGPVKDNFERIAKGWEIILGTEVTSVQVALCMDWLKTCRLLHSHHIDSYIDKAGYSAIAGELGENE